MRILHTSDWHLGQHFMGHTRHAEHRQLIDWLLQQVQLHHVDAVIIAGDVFDTGAPPSYARELYHQLIARLHAAGTALLVLAGNHDSVSMLEESVPLLQHLHTRVIASTHADDPAQHVLTLPMHASALNAASDARTPGAIVCALPFIRPRDVLLSQHLQSAEDKQHALQNAIASTYAQVYQAALVRQAELLAQTGQRLPIIATGHLTTVNAQLSESVREIYIGTLDALPVSAFPPADYIALGHIHRPQHIGEHTHIRYCGSPLALSFDEAGQAKQMLLVEWDTHGTRSITPLEIPMFQPMASVRGSLAQLQKMLPEAAAAGTPERPVWLEVTVVQDDYLSDLTDRIQALCAKLPVVVLRVKRQRAAAAAQLDSRSGEALHELSPTEVFERRLQQEQLSPELQTALHARYQSVLNQLQHGQEHSA